MSRSGIPPTSLHRSFFERDSVICAKELIGKFLVHEACSGRILETEAYRETDDPASHLFSRPSARTFAAEHPAGTAYVYLNYGIHWLTNVLCKNPATGLSGFVLFRALEPVSGIELMHTRRSTDRTENLCSGPGKISAALGVGRDHHGKSLVQNTGFLLGEKAGLEKFEIVADRRVGISAAKELRWRFLASGHPGVSVKYGKVR